MITFKEKPFRFRSLTLAEPYRGRKMRDQLRGRVPGARKLLDIYFRNEANRIANIGKRKLDSGLPEGRRFIAGIPLITAGIGHAHTEWHTAFQWAPQLELEFANIPLKTITSDRWCRFFGHNDLPKYNDILKEHKPVIVHVPFVATKASLGSDVPRKIKDFVESIRSHRNLLFLLGDGQSAFDMITHFAKSKELFENKGDWRSLPIHRQAGRINIAVHIRRGEVARMAAEKAGNWQERYVQEDWFVKIMDSVVDACQGKQLVFHVYSEGNPINFPMIAARKDVELHLDLSEQETILNMVRADVLIMSPSGFSYLAAMLSSGIKIVRYPWWGYIPDTDGWIRVHKGQRLSTNVLRVSLGEILENPFINPTGPL
jgi:hypothetical protein